MMADKPVNRPPTLLDGPFEPLSGEDRKRLAEEWAERTINELMVYANVERSFRYLLCNKVVKDFCSDDELSKLMLQLLNDARKGKPKGPRKTWNKSRYTVMLIHYEVRRELWGRKDALEWIAHDEGIGINGEQDCNIKKVEDKITEARKQVPEWRDHLPEFLKDIRTKR